MASRGIVIENIENRWLFGPSSLHRVMVNFDWNLLVWALDSNICTLLLILFNIALFSWGEPPLWWHYSLHEGLPFKKKIILKWCLQPHTVSYEASKCWLAERQTHSGCGTISCPLVNSEQLSNPIHLKHLVSRIGLQQLYCVVKGQYSAYAASLQRCLSSSLFHDNTFADWSHN